MTRIIYDVSCNINTMHIIIFRSTRINICSRSCIRIGTSLRRIIISSV